MLSDDDDFDDERKLVRRVSFNAAKERYTEANCKNPKIWTPEKFAVFILKFEQCGSAIE